MVCRALSFRLCATDSEDREVDSDTNHRDVIIFITITHLKMPPKCTIRKRQIVDLDKVYRPV